MENKILKLPRTFATMEALLDLRDWCRIVDGEDMVACSRVVASVLSHGGLMKCNAVIVCELRVDMATR